MNCKHSRQRLMIQAYQCQVCGRVEQRRVHQGIGTPPTTLVRQGLLTPDILIDSLQLTGEDAEFLRSIEPCTHPADKQMEERCGNSGKPRVRCSDCSRQWSTVGKA